MSDSISGIGKIGGAQLGINLGSFDPTPKSTAVERFFSKTLGALKNFGELATGFGEEQAMAKINPTYADLIEKQLQAQEQMQLVSMVSNIEKSKHETEMAAIRNIRVG